MRVRVQGLDELQVGDGGVDTRLLEQLVDVEQAAALAQMVRVAATRGMLDGSLDAEDVARAIFDLMESHGWSSLAPNGRAAAGLALPRPQELMEVLLRWRDR